MTGPLQFAVSIRIVASGQWVLTDSSLDDLAETGQVMRVF